MTGRPTILLLPDALRHAHADPAHARTVGGWRRTIRRTRPDPSDPGRRVSIERAGITLEEFDETRRLLAAGAYRPARTGPLLTRRAQDEVVLRETFRARRAMASAMGRTRRALGGTDAPVATAPHAKGIVWSMPIHDMEDAERLDSMDALALHIEGTVRGIVADRDMMVRVDEAMDALASLHIGGRGLASCMMATPTSPARISVADRMPAGLIAAAGTVPGWDAVDVDAEIEALMPRVLAVDSENRPSGTAIVPSPILRPFSRIVRAGTCADPVQALRILRSLAEDPIR